MDFKNFIAAHGMWKNRLRTAIDTGTSEFTVAATQVDDRCDFGKFFQALPAELKNADIGRRVREKHAAFHREAARVLDLALKGKKDEASKAIALGSTFATLSGELTTLMMEWQKKSAA